ncbi:MAG: GTP-binding protein, partial [Bacteroidales bacterium]|nr:GTP-binding protein [Bacteroidales bacterium]
VYQTSCCDVDIEAVLLGGHRIPEASKTAALGSLSAPHHIETKVLSSSNRLPKEQMERFLSVADTCIRAKGFFNCSDGERYMLQCASGVTQAIPVVQRSALSQMVFIGCDVNWTQLSSFFE